jgi:tRNA G10  N-methylase Trm11
MSTYLFQLGHCPELSHAEILSVNARLQNPLSEIRRIGSNLLADCESAEACVSLAESLAGTIRVCELVVHDRQKGSFVKPEELAPWLIEQDLNRYLPDEEKRPLFGLSLITEYRAKRKEYGLLHDTAALLKDHYKEQDLGSRFVLPMPDSEHSVLSGAQVVKNKLLSGGIEIVLFFTLEEGVLVGVTRWIQGYEAFSQRDYGRPKRDAKSGMLPPKLAKMLINLAVTPNSKSLLDPFCGSGSVLSEAALMGLHATGFDLSDKAVKDSNANWRWFQENVPNCTGTFRVAVGDARMLHTLCEPLYFDCCVTEPYMGPPQSKPVPRGKFTALMKELKDLYIRALGEIRTVVKPGSRVVFIVPRFKVQDMPEPQSISIAGAIQLQGYTVLDPLQGFAPSGKKTSLVYSRSKQIVQREIYVLQA